MATNSIYMADGSVSTGKTFSIWMSDDTASALAIEANIQETTKSRVFRMALMRYVDEMDLEREYLGALEDIRGRKYD